jgi:hypothetical protein
MKILKNTLQVEIDTWDDPGDYPSNMGSGPLPSYKYIDRVEGEVVVELDPEELDCYLEDPSDILNDIPMPKEISSWKLAEEKVEGNIITLYVADFEASDYEAEPDYKEDWDEVDF